MPCAAGVEGLLADEIHQLTGLTGNDLLTGRGGVMANASWRDALRVNLHSRLTQRVLIQLSQTFYRNEKDLYDAAFAVAWEIWFTTKQTFKIEITAQHSPLTSLNFAALKIKDAVADRFRDKRGERPDVNTQWPDVRIYVHLTTDSCTLYMDTSGEPLFKRGWREDKGDAPLKETLAAAMLAASGWDAHTPLYDPCCGSGTIAIEAAQIACGIAPGILRRFGFEKLLPFQPHVWQALQEDARAQEHEPLQKFMRLMLPSGWLTSHNATLNAQALAKWCRRAAAMHFSACHLAKHPASCCSTRLMANALQQRVWRACLAETETVKTLALAGRVIALI